MSSRKLIIRGYDKTCEYFIYKENSQYKFIIYTLSRPEDELQPIIKSYHSSFKNVFIKELHELCLYIYITYIDQEYISLTIELLNDSIQFFKNTDEFNKGFLSLYFINGNEVYKQWERVLNIEIKHLL